MVHVDPPKPKELLDGDAVDGLTLPTSNYTVLYYPRRLLAHRDRVQGIRLDVRGDFVSVRDWWLDPAVPNGAARSGGQALSQSMRNSAE